MQSKRSYFVSVKIPHCKYNQQRTQQEVFAVQKRHPSDKTRQKPKCDKCGNQHYHQQVCPAQGAECYNCGRKHHFAKVCRTRSVTNYHKKVQSVLQYDSSDASDKLFIDMVKCSINESSDWKVTFIVNDQKTRFKIDTGAQCNVISRHTYHRLGSLPLQNLMPG